MSKLVKTSSEFVSKLVEKSSEFVQIRFKRGKYARVKRKNLKRR